MDIIKTETKEGKCYGVVYNPTYHVVKICYRGVDDITLEPEDMTDKQKQAMEVFGARFLAPYLDKTEDELVTEIDADFTARVDKITAVEEPDVKEIK
jgi:hypothetical protein